MLKHLVIVFALSLTLLFAGYAMASDIPLAAGTQARCPILGGKIDKKIYADYEGKRIYFCCPGCIGEFKKSPAKYTREMEGKGVQLEKVPAVQ